MGWKVEERIGRLSNAVTQGRADDPQDVSESPTPINLPEPRGVWCEGDLGEGGVKDACSLAAVQKIIFIGCNQVAVCDEST